LTRASRDRPLRFAAEVGHHFDAHLVTQAPPADAAHRPARLGYLPGIDGLRAVSVLAVCVYHYYALGGLGTAGPTPGGFMGVEVFFVISGYLITALLLREHRHSGTISLREFWVRRARRLLPALFVLLAVGIVYTVVWRRDLLGTLKGDVVAALTYTSNWWQMAADRSYVAEGTPELLKHLWSLAIEEQFYLLWPPLLALALRRLGRGRTVLAMVGTALASTLLMAALVPAAAAGVPLDASDVYYSTLTRLSGLLLGGVLAFAWTPDRLVGRPGRGAGIVLDAAGLVGLYLLWRSFRSFHFDDASTFRGGFLYVDVATLLVVGAVVHPASRLGRLLGARPLQWIGLRSYGLYLWHYPIFAVTRPVADNGWWWPVTLVVRVGLTLAATETSYRYVETPIRQGVIGDYLHRVRAARGVRRRRLARRGFATALLASLVAVGLGTGLANAEPRVERVHGIDDAAQENEQGDRPDPAALAAISGRVTSTTRLQPTATTTPLAPGGTTVPTAVPTTTPTTVPPPPPPPPAVLGIGDSVMLGAKRELEATVAGMVVDGVVSRQFAHAIPVLEVYAQQGVLPPIVVVHLGTNGRFGDGEFDHMMSVIGPDRTAFFLTARMPRSWEAEVNGTLAAGVSRHTNAQLIDWRQYAGCHSDWFANDGFHVTDVGAQAYASFVNAHVTNQGATLTYC
jgi:peptidoglycan/LPS O-acetylase OafA/YrhL